ncbi:MAG: matrixin family metalloprotease [Burkholderiales bacterium]
MKRWAVVLALLVGFGVAPGSRPTAQSGGQDPPILARIKQINRQLAASGLNIAVEQVEFFTFGAARPSFRIHQQPFRWVANDPRRLADGDNITYLVDQSEGKTASGLTSVQTEFAIDRAMDTWQAQSPFTNVDLVKRADTGEDPDIYDSFFGYGKFGNPFLADIVNAGWLPRAFFEEAGGPGGGRGILAFSVTFIFTNDDGTPTDFNGDNYLDSALNEVYYNDTFGKRGTDRAGNPWGINILLPGIDVQTVGLHENGHSLGVGHFGPPPDAVMNPVYAGIRHEPFPIDLTGMNAIWSSWPN